MLQKRIIYFLISFCVLLLVASIIIDYVKEPTEERLIKYESRLAIGAGFLSVMDNYGFDSSWVVKKHIRNKKFDSLIYVYHVQVPKDIPLTILVKDLNEKFKNKNVKIISREQKINGNTIVDFISNDVLKLQAHFRFNKNISRKFITIAFIVEVSQTINEEELEKLLESPFPVSLILIPSAKSLQIADRTLVLGKEYGLLLNDKIDEPKYSLEERSHKSILRNSVKQITSDFNNAALIIIDEKSALYNSVIFNFIADEFSKRKIHLLRKNDFIMLHADNKNELASRLKFFCDSDKTRAKLFYLNIEDYFKLMSTIEMYKKKGNKILLASKVISGN